MSLARTFTLAALACSTVLVDAAPAHVVTVDGQPAEWFATPAPVANLGRIARRPGGDGEYVWRDAIGDARPAWPARAHDLSDFRVTADRDSLYLLARLANGGAVAVAGDSVPQLQVTIDTNRFFYLGGTAFADSAGFEVSGNGAYELLVETRFGSGLPPRLLDGWGNELEPVAHAALSPSGAIEVAVPWSALGFQFVPTAPLRFAAALFLTNAADVALDPADGVLARAADVMTQYADPGTLLATTFELGDGVLDYTADVWFDVRGEVVAPLVVNEAFFEAGVNSQWVEIVNPTQSVVSLNGCKFGDEETPDGPEGMGQFPSGMLLVPGQAVVVARNGATFFAEYGVRAGAECGGGDPATPDMLPYAPWCNGTAFNIPNAGDELLVLDAANTVVDVVTFKNASWPGIVPHPGTPALMSLERANPALDTDDCASDFGSQPAPNPGAVVIVAGADGSPGGTAFAWAPPAPNPLRGRAALALRLPVAGAVRVTVVDAAGRLVRTLHDGAAAAGELRLAWDTRDAGGRPVAPGVYFVRAERPGEHAAVRLAVLR